MIVTKTPLRISFFSGGSDLPSFYMKDIGAALSVTIDKFIYVFQLQTPNTGVKTIFDKIEEVSDISLLQHDITKNALEYLNLTSNITVGSISDIPTKGSGLGSSSAFTVGLLRPYFEDFAVSKLYVAELAYKIERELCNFSVGKQDQYAAAVGGLNLFEFYDTGYVNISNSNKDLELFASKLLLVYSGKGRSANVILNKQKDAADNKEKFNLMSAGRDKAYTGWRLLKENKFDDFGDLLNEAWKEKKSIVSEITNDYFDDIYDKAMKAGALGGKLLGAGGGGFFIFYVPESNRSSVINAVTTNTECKVYDFKFYNEGSKIITRD